MDVDFYVTQLDSEAKAVLGYNWLFEYNPLIDWKQAKLIFHTPLDKGSSMPSPPQIPLSNSEVTLLQDKSTSGQNIPKVSLVNGPAFLRATRQPNSVSFMMQITPSTSCILQKQNHQTSS